MTNGCVAANPMNETPMIVSIWVVKTEMDEEELTIGKVTSAPVDFPIHLDWSVLTSVGQWGS